jgi:hypothetical protein
MYFPTVNTGGQDMIKTIICVAGIMSLSACSGLRTTDNSYEAHAENFNILFLQIPGGDTQERALKLVPKGGEITTMNSAPNDLTSLISVINRIIGIDITTIDGTISKK